MGPREQRHGQRLQRTLGALVGRRAKWVVVTAALVLSAGAQTAERRATFNGRGGDSGKCTIEVEVDGVVDVEIRGDLLALLEAVYQAMKEACSDCVLYMPVPLLEDMIPEQNYFATVLGFLQGKGLVDIGFDYHTWGMSIDTWVTKGEYYTRHGDFIEKIKSIAGANGFDVSNIISAEAGGARVPTGRVTMNVLPRPSSLSTSMEPPRARVSSRQMLRPRPVPRPRPLVV